MLNFFKHNLPIILVAFWLGTTLSLTIWWLYFGLSQLPYHISIQLAEKQRMLIWEGAVFMFLLILAAFVMAYYIYLEKRRNYKIKQFFATFSHDLKTSLASLRLQVESLNEDMQGKDIINSKLMQRLISDTTRLELQLENSLFLSEPTNLILFKEELILSYIIDRFQYRWPNIQLKLRGNAKITGDLRALESILSNIIQNSVVHGQASEINFKVKSSSDYKIVLDIQDDGGGFSGDLKRLTCLFERHSSRSGSGVGLFVSKLLIRHMNGDIYFPTPSKGGFKVCLILQGKLL